MAVICGEALIFAGFVGIRLPEADGWGRLRNGWEPLGTVVVPLGTVGDGWGQLKAGRAPSEAVWDRPQPAGPANIESHTLPGIHDQLKQNSPS
jgi:hypothetical protein